MAASETWRKRPHHDKHFSLVPWPDSVTQTTLRERLRQGKLTAIPASVCRVAEGPGTVLRVLSNSDAIVQKIALIVDDEWSVRTYIRAVLESDGFHTIEAEDGMQALKLMRKLGTGVDLLIADQDATNGRDCAGAR